MLSSNDPLLFPERLRCRASVIRSLIIFLVLAISAGPALASNSGHQNTASGESHGHFPYTNRLISSRDPYLLLHAHNPVDWYRWGDEALAEAKRENRPIFISIGYSTCYWCHVAERTIYSNPKIAKLMNQWFVNIKVDREQLPDVDRLYILATALMTGQGGWPNNVFLTPTSNRSSRAAISRQTTSRAFEENPPILDE